MFILYNLSDTGFTTSTVSTFEIILQLLFIVFIFALILFLATFSTRIIGGNKMKTMRNNNMKVMETISLGTNYLHIVKVAEQYFLVSSSKEGVGMMTELKSEGLNFEENFEIFSFEERLKNCIQNFKAKDKIGGENEKEE